MKKLTWNELKDYLYGHEDRQGVIVFKNGPYWKQKYPLKSRSYRVSGKDNYFQPDKISNSFYGSNLDGTDVCIRLDLEMYYNKWQIDYCYILED